MVATVHLLCLGAEPVPMHTAGITFFGAREALLFVPPNPGEELRKRMEEITSLSRFGAPIRPVTTTPTYRHAFPSAVAELEGYVESGTRIAVNIGTGPPSMVHAVCDATLAALIAYHPPHADSDEGAASGFRYFPRRVESGEFDIMPFSNLANARHREIVLALLQQDEPATMRTLHDSVTSTMAPEERYGYDNFRRYFNGVRRWFKHVPDFVEEKGESYRYRV